MKLSCLQENLAKGLSIVGRAVSTRSTLPVLGNVLLATDTGRLRLSATNLEVVITCWIGAKVLEDGEITVPARTFADLVNALPQERVDLNLQAETNTINVDCARTTANIRGIAATEFPLVPEPDEENRIRLETKVFKEMISQVTFAAATDDTRPILTGVSTRFEGNTMTMAATDGFRLSVRNAEFPGFVEEPVSVIIPARALSELARIVDPEVEHIFVSLPTDRNQIIFDMDNIVMVSQLIEGSFPDYTPVIPNKHMTRSVIGTAAFLKACRTADIFARDSNHTARVRVEPGDELQPGHAVISATSSETGDNVAQIDANVVGDPIEIAFNVKYMTDVLNVIDSPQVALETTRATEPGVVKPVGSEEFFHIIMPMHFGR